MGDPAGVLSALCNGLIRPEPLPSWFVGLFVQLHGSMVTTGYATGLEKTLLGSGIVIACRCCVDEKCIIKCMCFLMLENLYLFI